MKVLKSDHYDSEEDKNSDKNSVGVKDIYELGHC